MPNQHSKWLSGGGKVHIIAVYGGDNASLKAIFPGYVDEKGQFRFINDLDTDFCDIVIQNNCRTDFSVYAEIAKHIIADKSIRGINLINMRAHSYVGAFFSNLLTPSLSYGYKAYSIFQVDTRNGEEHYLDTLRHLNAKERHRVKKVANKMTDTTFSIFRADKEYPKDALCELMQQMIATGIREDDYLSKMESLVEKLYSLGLLTIGITSVNDRPLAANIFIRKGNAGEYINWLVFYTDKQYNLWNLLQCIEYISNHGGGTFNFARGTYEYKMRNFRPTLQTLYRFDYSKSMLGSIKVSMKQLNYFVRILGKRIVEEDNNSFLAKFVSYLK